MQGITQGGSKIFTKFQSKINSFKNLFTHFAYGITFFEKVVAVGARVSGCTHPDPFLNDLGDEDHEWWYCFRCHRKLSIQKQGYASQKDYEESNEK